MTTETLGFFARLALAWRILWSGLLASTAQRALEAGTPEPPAALPPKEEPAEQPAAPQEAAPADISPALQVLTLLQREGRLIDFLNEEVSGFSDAEVGAAARVVHDGCQKVLREYFEVRPVRSETEGAAITLEPGFDAARHRLTGDVKGEPPYRGVLAHAGWEVVDIRLPERKAGIEAQILAPAEVEL